MNPTGTEGSREKKIDNTVGSRIRKLREERGIKQMYIANEMWWHKILVTDYLRFTG